jgi:hypothetical protein
MLFCDSSTNGPSRPGSGAEGDLELLLCRFSRPDGCPDGCPDLLSLYHWEGVMRRTPRYMEQQWSTTDAWLVVELARGPHR